MEANPILRPTTLANLRYGTHDLELSLRVVPDFTPYLAPALRYRFLATVDGVSARLRAHEKHVYGHRSKRRHDAEGRARAQMLRAAATAFLDYVSPFATAITIDDVPWPEDVWDYNRDPFLPRFFRWKPSESDSTDSIYRSFEPILESKRSLVDAAPILIRELQTYFTVEYAVSTKR